MNHNDYNSDEDQIRLLVGASLFPPGRAYLLPPTLLSDISPRVELAEEANHDITEELEEGLSEISPIHFDLFLVWMHHNTLPAGQATDPTTYTTLASLDAIASTFRSRVLQNALIDRLATLLRHPDSGPAFRVAFLDVYRTCAVDEGFFTVCIDALLCFIALGHVRWLRRLVREAEALGLDFAWEIRRMRMEHEENPRTDRFTVPLYMTDASEYYHPNEEEGGRPARTWPWPPGTGGGEGEGGS
ncbi:hypothetical protein MMC14_004788 [Varicellaria rhodocarpa]|nr:hypothetical protein [Varicellaria rhodocarpa]